MTHAEYKALREYLGTQTEIAAALGCTRSTIARRESGRLLIRPADALHLTSLVEISKRLNDALQPGAAPDLPARPIEAAAKANRQKSGPRAPRPTPHAPHRTHNRHAVTHTTK